MIGLPRTRVSKRHAPRNPQTAELLVDIVDIHRASRRTYGAPRVHGARTKPAEPTNQVEIAYVSMGPHGHGHEDQHPAPTHRAQPAQADGPNAHVPHAT